MVSLEKVPEEELESLHEEFQALPAWRRKSFEAFVAVKRYQQDRTFMLHHSTPPTAVHPPVNLK